MKKRTSKKAALVRSILILPVFALLLYGFSETKIIERKVGPSITTENYQVSERFESITIKINEKQEVLVENEVVQLKFLSSRLLQIINSTNHKKDFLQKVQIEAKGNLDIHLLELIKEQITEAGAILEMVTADIIKIEDKYLNEKFKGVGFTVKDSIHIKLENDKIIKGITDRKDLNVSTNQQIKKYNTLAKKYNAVPIENRKIPLKDLKVLEGIYKQMTKTQRKEAQPFPECLPKSIQEGASRKQMAEYNSLAKKYNEMDSNRMRILKSDVERLEYIYGLMSDKQKADAEPFPDFPEPPPAPDAPKAPNEREEASNTIQKIIDEQDPYDQVTISIDRTSKPSKHTAVYIGSENDKNKIEKQMSKSVNTPKSPRSPRVLKGQASTIPPPPAAKTAPKVLKGEESSIPTPPLPPEPIAPLDYAIAMAKKGAKFYYEGKEVSSDKAIELLKKNKNLNIDSRSAKGTRVVLLSKEPITIK